MFTHCLAKIVQVVEMGERQTSGTCVEYNTLITYICNNVVILFVRWNSLNMSTLGSHDVCKESVI